jgi:uncharacterized protein
MSVPSPQHEYAPPAIDPTNRRFWEATRQGQLMLGFCNFTGRYFFHPRGVSPFGLSTDVSLKAAVGAGTIYSVSVVRSKEPYAIAFVELSEGPRILTNIVDCNVDALRIGQAVRLVFRATAANGPPLPLFVPA